MAFLIGFALQFLVIYCPGINDIFNLSPLGIGNFMICMGLSLVMVVIMEIVKFVNRRQLKK